LFIADCFQHPWRGSCIFGADEADRANSGCASALHKVVLEIELAFVSQHSCGDRVIAHRQDVRSDSPGGREVSDDGRQRIAATQSLGAQHMQRKISIAQGEPVLAAQRANRIHEPPGLVGPAPALHRVGLSGQRVEKGIDVR
jgi:hypothetical protein